LDELILNKLKNVDGEGSGLDADLLRGLPADFSCSKTQNGYTKLPNGLIIQWGRYDGGEDEPVQINFPITFPTTCFSVVITMQQVTCQGMFYTERLDIKEISNSYFKVVRPGDSITVHGFYWLAIGY